MARTFLDGNLKKMGLSFLGELLLEGAS